MSGSCSFEMAKLSEICSRYRIVASYHLRGMHCLCGMCYYSTWESSFVSYHLRGMYCLCGMCYLLI